MKAHHKVGVLRVKEGQRNEEDIFCNCHESGHFDEFLNVLGKELGTCFNLELMHALFSFVMQLLFGNELLFLPSVMGAGGTLFW